MKNPFDDGTAQGSYSFKKDSMEESKREIVSICFCNMSTFFAYFLILSG
jgi:hypothetical protein